ncbi:unnamed protein product [Zymoseptoria tritici ST99CH_3D1]|nr:unnamed protein product [Zymoseptoria tritici ST99CH_3D1]
MANAPDDHDDTAAKQGSVYSLAYKYETNYSSNTHNTANPTNLPLPILQLNRTLPPPRPKRRLPRPPRHPTPLLSCQPLSHPQNHRHRLRSKTPPTPCSSRGLFPPQKSTGSVSDKPSNLEFIQGNILHLLADGKDERLKEGSFDLVFSRLLISGMQDWKGYIEAVAKLLKPGGVLEMQDIAEWEFYLGDVPSSSSSSTMKPISQTENWQWPRFALEKMTAPPSRGGQGLDMGTFNRADEILREVGLEGVEKRLVGLPCDVELKGFEEGKRDVLREGRKAWRAAILKMMGGMLEGDERKEEMMGEVERTTEAREGMWFPFVVVWGRRPE